MRPFELETYFSRWEFSARYHMTASDVESMTIAELLAMAQVEPGALLDTWLGYTETWGDPELRAAIAADYECVEADDVLCFCGAEEGVYAAMRVLLSPADHAIVVVPNYQAAETLPLDICEVSGVALRESARWSLDLDEVRAALRPNTRLVSINFPNNPTGSIMSLPDMQALVALCREHGIALFSDEVYRGLERDESRRLPPVADLYENGLSLNVMSKAYGLPGLRIGWIATRNRDYLQALERYKHYLSICNSAPSEKLAIIAFGVKDQILQRNRALVQDNLSRLDSFFSEYPALFDWEPPDGGCIAYPRFKGEQGVEAFCESLVSEAGVLLLPASIYRSELLPTPSDRFRIGFGRRHIDEGLAAMRAYLGANMD